MDLSETMLANWKPWIIVAHDPIYPDFGELIRFPRFLIVLKEQRVKERDSSLLERGGK